MSSTQLVLGAVAYDAKVVPIWDGFKAYFEARGLPFDFVLFSNYERQVAAHLRGELDVAWNSPLAWLHAQRAEPARARAIAMRDTDRDLTSVVLARADGPVRGAADLRGKRVGVGAADSPQATLIPLVALGDAGLEAGRDFTVVRHDVLVGKHGDHIGGERDAVKALLAGAVDAACVIDGNHAAFAKEGLIAAGQLRVVLQTGHYDHCNFTVIGDDTPLIAKFREVLLAMSYEDAAVRPLLDMEGLKTWLPGRTSGYALLARALGKYDAQ
jgi:ABC-type phosphate/phosphonate transport system substrate-binding protein|nr:PhnD/SsuA/transferrin family substrate-binding protein [Kofleriaceae bacterium]